MAKNANFANNMKGILDNSQSRIGNSFIIFNLIAPIGKCNILNFNFRLRWMQNFQVAVFWETRKADNVQCKLATFCLYSFVSVKISFKKKIPKWASSVLVNMDIYMGTDMGTTLWYKQLLKIYNMI